MFDSLHLTAHQPLNAACIFSAHQHSACHMTMHAKTYTSCTIDSIVVPLITSLLCCACQAPPGAGKTTVVPLALLLHNPDYLKAGAKIMVGWRQGLPDS